MTLNLLDLLGLLITLAGAVVLCSGLLISSRGALDVGVSRAVESNDRDNICLPTVQDRLKQARHARIGMMLFTIGFLLQIAGSWPW